MGYIVIDLFCGCGGFSKGFLDEGFNVVLGIDIDKSALKSFSTNIPGAIPLCMDIREVRGEDLMKIIKRDSIDVVIGSPPCESFTPINHRRKKECLDRLYLDENGMLTLHFIRLIGDLKPRIFIMENVPQIISGYLKKALKWEFSRVGYDKIYFNILKAENFLTPSIRRRIFISNILLKDGYSMKKVSVEEALNDLTSPQEIIRHQNHELTPLSEKKIRKIAKLKWGEALIVFQGANGKFYKNWIRLHPKKIAPTVIGRSRFIHPYENRLLTVREQARLMGFPDQYVFYGQKEEQYNQVGEAVPPTLSKAIAKQVIKCLKVGEKCA
ncbi:MAG: DNA cytosine methyltransferase [Candidatus Methanomethylicia archaeon]|nr:DNA cytosine methyltransferase [Candidatus Methanomethylicia archaeon]